MPETPQRPRITFDRVTLRRFGRAVRDFSRSKAGRKAKAMALLLVVLVFAINGLNVVTSYVGRDFMTAIAQRNLPGFFREGALYVGMFLIATFAAVILHFIEERLGLLWRDWMTTQMIARYMEHPVYYQLSDHGLHNGEVANPDQRIAEDVRVFTVTTISFLLLLLNAGMTAISFSGVMWSISPLLLGIGVAYASVGSYGAVRLGHRLIGLQYEQLDKEASFRSELVHVREHGEAIALLRHEPLFRARLTLRLFALVRNFRRITRVNRNLGFFTTGYNYLIQVIPALIIAPAFIHGKVEFGVITQSTVAFTQLLGAFSLIVTQFQSISSFSAVVSRLDALNQALDEARSQSRLNQERLETPEADRASEPAPPQAPQMSASPVAQESESRVAYDQLTLRAPRDGAVLVQDLSVAIPNGTRVRILGDNASGKQALFRATAGVWDIDQGRVIVPGPDSIMFLPEQPYVPPGTLRELLAPPARTSLLPDSAFEDALRALGLEALLEHAGGLDREQDWTSMLSLAEQQLLCLARVLLARPRFVFLDRPGGALPEDVLERAFAALKQRSIAYVVIGEGDIPKGRYDATLELREGGAWSWNPAA